MSECKCDACFSGVDEIEYRARGCPSCTCQPAEPSAEIKAKAKEINSTLRGYDEHLRPVASTDPAPDQKPASSNVAKNGSEVDQPASAGREYVNDQHLFSNALKAAEDSAQGSEWAKASAVYAVVRAEAFDAVVKEQDAASARVDDLIEDLKQESQWHKEARAELAEAHSAKRKAKRALEDAVKTSHEAVEMFKAENAHLKKMNSELSVENAELKDEMANSGKFAQDQENTIAELRAEQVRRFKLFDEQGDKLTAARAEVGMLKSPLALQIATAERDCYKAALERIATTSGKHTLPTEEGIIARKALGVND